MSVESDKLQAAKLLVSRVLRGEITPDESPEYFDEDVVYIQVGIAEKQDLEWLKKELASSDFEKEAKLNVVIQMTGPERAPLLASLGGLGLK